MYRLRRLLDDLPALSAALSMIAFTVMLMVWMVQGRGPQAAHAPEEPLTAEMAAATAPVAPSVQPLVKDSTETGTEITVDTSPDTETDSVIPDIAAFETKAPPVEVPAWRRYAALAPEIGSKPMVAIVIDDVGMSRKRARRAIDLKATVTLAFLPYADKLPEMSRRARARGHEVMVHMPMEALDPHADPGAGGRSRPKWTPSRFASN